MKNTLQKVSAFVLASAIAPIASADVVFSHTALTQICEHSNSVLGTCVTSHTGGGVTQAQLDCKLQKASMNIASFTSLETNLESNTSFTMHLNGSLVANQLFCTRNVSKYLTQSGQVATGQQSAQNCKVHSPNDGGIGN